MAASGVEGQVQLWNVDPQHSSVNLSVRHMGLFTVRGSLERLSGVIKTTGGKLTEIQAKIEAASINTGNQDRDKHLRSEDFLNTEKFPLITFQSTHIQPQRNGNYTVTGDLSIRGQSHPVTFDVETMEPIKDPFGMIRSGGTAEGQFSRKQWDLTWNQVLETGSLMVGDEIKFTLDVQAVAAGS